MTSAVPRCRIVNQADSRAARRAIGFCYLCGRSLPARGDKGRRRAITGEHVVPRALLGDTPGRDADKWTIVLDVHSECERKNKQPVDHLMNLLQTMNITPVPEWPDFGHLRGLGLKPLLLVAPDGRSAVPVFSNARELIQGAWNWVRGLHAALYSEYLPASSKHSVLPPVPAFSSSGGISMLEAEGMSFVSRGAVDLAIKHDKWDGIDAWGRRLRYRCVWKHLPAEFGGPSWFCCWALLFPGVLEWSRTVLPQGHERPWHGLYSRRVLPTGASHLLSEDFPTEPRR